MLTWVITGGILAAAAAIGLWEIGGALCRHQKAGWRRVGRALSIGSLLGAAFYFCSVIAAVVLELRDLAAILVDGRPGAGG